MERILRMEWVFMAFLAMVSFATATAYADTITTNQVVVKANAVEGFALSLTV